MNNVIFCQTVGLEVEVTDVNTHNIRLPSGWNTTSDASVEKDVITLNGIPLENHTDISGLDLRSNVYGGELLSSIIDTQNEYLSNLKYLCSELIRRGEPFKSERAGLHVHLSFTRPNLTILKTIIKLGCHLEDVFFLVGGMGYEFRGFKNDSSYCRPITTPGPQVITDIVGNLYPCLVINDLLEATSVDEFKVRLGDYSNLNSSKYIPIRYLWLNLYNLWLKKETLEFRIFNRTLKPRYMEAAIELCRAFGDAVMYYTYHIDELEELTCNSVYDYREKEDIINTFLSFANQRIDPRVIDTLLRIMDGTPIESIRFPKKPFWFHLRFHRNGSRSPTHWMHSTYRPSISYKRSEVLRPNFADIHNLRAGGVRELVNEDTELEEDSSIDFLDDPIVFEDEVSPTERTESSTRASISFDELREATERARIDMPNLSNWWDSVEPIQQDEPIILEDDDLEEEIDEE